MTIAPSPVYALPEQITGNPMDATPASYEERDSARRELEYRIQHENVYLERGKASIHNCFRCGRQARDWAWIHNSDRDNVISYIPVCRLCHCNYDRDHEKALVWDTPLFKKSPRLPSDVLSPREVYMLVGQCSTASFTGIRNRALLIFLYRSGLRVGEALALMPYNLDHKAHSIRVLHGKGDETSTRFWHHQADDSLNRWLDIRRVHTAWRSPLFCTVNGGPIDTSYVRTMTRRIGREAGIEKRVHPHILRHTFAVELESAGVSIRVISKLLGHKRISTTAIYLDHLSNRQAGIELTNTELLDLGRIE